MNLGELNQFGGKEHVSSLGDQIAPKEDGSKSKHRSRPIRDSRKPRRGGNAAEDELLVEDLEGEKKPAPPPPKKKKAAIGRYSSGITLKSMQRRGTSHQAPSGFVPSAEQIAARARAAGGGKKATAPSGASGTSSV